jgi:hypothetical protein
VIGYPIVTSISLTCHGLWESIDCAITFLAPFSGNIKLIFLNYKPLVSLFLKAFISLAYLVTPLTFSKVPPYSQLCDIFKIRDHGALGASIFVY